jgi:hypothetical protein
VAIQNQGLLRIYWYSCPGGYVVVEVVEKSQAPVSVARPLIPSMVALALPRESLGVA